MSKKIRKFNTGADRDKDDGKLDYEGVFNPLTKKKYAEYLFKCRIRKDGSVRPADNWQLGMPLDSYMKSLARHFEDLHLHHRGYPDEAREDIYDALCAVIFNAQGYLLEVLKSDRIKAKVVPKIDEKKTSGEKPGGKRHRA